VTRLLTLDTSGLTLCLAMRQTPDTSKAHLAHSASLPADLLAAAQQRAAGAGVASLGLNGNSLVITLSNGTQLSQDLSGASVSR
jgi:hypothetical protein